MKKEVLFAIMVGFLVGLVITFGIYQAQIARKKTLSKKPGSQIEQVAPQNNTFKIHTPGNFSVVDSETLTISGTATPNSYLAVIGQKTENIVQVNSDGTFTTQVDLVEAVNIITVSNILESGQTTETELTITLDEKVLNPAPEVTPEPNLEENQE